MSQRRNYKTKKGAVGASATTPTSAKETQLQMLSEMFPDWESEDLSSLLSEHRNDVEVVIDLIVNNKVSKWEPIKKEPRNKRRDDATKTTEHSNVGSVASNPHTASSADQRGGKFSRERQPKTDKRRERKPPAGPKKETPHAAVSSAGGSSSTPATSAPATTPAAATSVPSATSAPSGPIPSNSWAAALAKDNVKPKAKQATKTQEESTESSKEVAPSQTQPEISGEENKPEITAELVQPVPPQKTQSSNVQTSTSWASAIKPKAKPVQKKVSEPEPEQLEAVSREPEASQVETQSVPEEAVTAVTEEEVITEEAPEAPEVQEPEQPSEPVSIPVLESEVVLPQQVNNVGVSFGSLSLEDAKQPEPAAVESQTKEPTQEVPSFVAKQEETESLQQNAVSQQPQENQPVQEQVKAQEQSVQHEAQQQTEQQAYQQQYEQQRKANSSQGYDYYNQFQQTQQQFPQQAGAGSIPAQFGYPSFDYSAYGQLNQTGLGSMGSPGYYQVNTANNLKTATPGANPSGPAEISQSPLVAHSTQQGLQTPQQNQQVPGGAPFAYPNYYSYFYNTPFYGNGAGMGATNSAYGMQQAQPQQQHQQPQGSDAGAENENAAGQNTTQSAQAANQFYAAQYYGNPNQFGSRGGYPYNGYPSSQPYPQGSQTGEQTETPQNGQQQGSHQATPAPSGVPQYHPQYAGYQQYPQYGTYQDNSQYRGWY
ncbi:hypothetical protein JCM33374_g5372 [Metschnikowia sp. JCM 33374]|nr:hypothetical protein JCM33374_g5372 [Metschnikowia sp. JCM 33374]